MHTPRKVDLAITHHCNLRCTYCSHFSSAGDAGRDLSTGEWLQFFEELNRCAVMDVTLQGGEPFCRADFFALVDGIVENRMRFSILSNGTLITDDLAASLAGTGRCNSIQVSIDGSTPEVHDTCRGRGSFARALEGISYLREHGIPVSVRVTLHRQNVDHLDEIAKFLLEDLGLPSFSTNAASFFGLCREHTDAVQLTPEDRTTAMATLLSLNQQYDGRISATAGPLAEAKHWTMMEEARKEGRASLSGGGHLTGCGCTMSSIAVRADGAIVPCILLSHLELGRINRDDLGEIWRTHPEMQRMRSRREIPLDQFSFCQGCPYIPYCTGNCPALAATLLGDVYHPSPDACLRRFLAAGGRLPEEEV
ncbi:SynChlorMet cassette radical SAM/SPASM protein ScmE [Methanofollis aquaemaris]|uniref:SynChlorMet cassette radical SAM/SPASM protein ScmE n=2 Tax=Methanofollis aquaemaris TaxID=126734 RepID=A0A8A3S8A4_9EURY|nr:SynChlorMet cassette radical SAM/SPASM protein ScmE [Methanofollis aquaemaris]